MAWSWTPARRDEPELMDASGLPEDEVEDAYRTLRRVNRQLGNLRSMRREVQRFLEENQPGSVGFTLLDVGSGSGDVPQAVRDVLQSRQMEVVALALDRDTTAVKLARRQGLSVVRGNALQLPFGDQSIDLVTAIKFAHHFRGSRLDRLIAEMTRVARRRVIILDIRRHWLAYWGFIAWSRLFTRNRLVRYDGPLSVFRGFTAAELTEVAVRVPQFAWTVRSYAGFQLTLVGQRVEVSPQS